MKVINQTKKISIKEIKFQSKAQIKWKKVNCQFQRKKN